MKNDNVFKSVPLIDLKDLDGKTVTLIVEYKEDYIALAGYELETDTLYLLSVEYPDQASKLVH